MTPAAWFEITLIDRVVLSADAATAGGHRSLSYIPGSAVLGAFAGLAYPAWAGTLEGFTAFHSGRLRFGDAMPVGRNGLAWPVPLSMHRETAGGGTRHRWTNLASPASVPFADADWEQVREGFVDAQHAYLQPTLTRSQRTAVAQETGRAKRRALFEYQALERGQRFAAPIWVERGAEPVWDALRQLAGERRLLRLGRSRGSEFGRAELNEISAPPALPAAAVDMTADAPIIFWALGDLAITDAHGLPTLLPEPAAFGLPRGARFAPEFSFLAPASTWPQNLAFGGRMPQRALLRAGSVIAFHPAPGEARMMPGVRHIGLHQAAGLGCVMCDADLLHRLEIRVREIKPMAIEPASQEASPEENAFVAWVQQRGGRQAATDRSAIDGEVHSLERMQEIARAQGQAAPGSTQWGVVRMLAEQNRNAAALMTVLFGEQGPCADADGLWGNAAAVPVNGTLVSFGEQLKTTLERLQHEHPERASALLALLAREMQRRQARMANGAGEGPVPPPPGPSASSHEERGGEA